MGFLKPLLGEVFLYQLREMDDGTWEAVMGGSNRLACAANRVWGLERPGYQ